MSFATNESPDQQDMSERLFNKTELDENVPEFGLDSSSLRSKGFFTVTSKVSLDITAVDVHLPEKSNDQKLRDGSNYKNSKTNRLLSTETRADAGKCLAVTQIKDVLDGR